MRTALTVLGRNQFGLYRLMARVEADKRRSERVWPIADVIREGRVPIQESSSDFRAKPIRRVAEKFLISRQLPALLPQPVQLSAFLAGEDAMVFLNSLAAIDTGLENPGGQSAGGKARLLGHFVTREARLQVAVSRFVWRLIDSYPATQLASGNSLLTLLRRKPMSGLGGDGH